MSALPWHEKAPAIRPDQSLRNPPELWNPLFPFLSHQTNNSGKSSQVALPIRQARNANGLIDSRYPAIFIAIPRQIGKNLFDNSRQRSISVSFSTVDESF